MNMALAAPKLILCSLCIFTNILSYVCMQHHQDIPSLFPCSFPGAYGQSQFMQWETSESSYPGLEPTHFCHETLANRNPASVQKATLVKELESIFGNITYILYFNFIIYMGYMYVTCVACVWYVCTADYVCVRMQVLTCQTEHLDSEKDLGGWLLPCTLLWARVSYSPL